MRAFVFGLVALGLTTACGSPSGPERALSGKQLFERHCARCHGPDGRGSAEMPSAKDLTNAGYMKDVPDERLRATILDGKPPNMPGFRSELAEPSIKVLVAYVRGFSDPSVVGATQPHEAAPAAEGDAGP